MKISDAKQNLCVIINFVKKQLSINRYGYNGEGVGEIDGKITFVPFSVQGEVCECEITKQDKNFQQAKLVEVVKKSDNRVDAKCPYFEKCGGCSIMHLCYSEQLKLKQNIVKNNLKKYANLLQPVSCCVKSPNEFNYRNKVVFAISKNAKLGFFMINSHDVIEIQTCCIVDDKINKFITLINNALKQFQSEVYDWKTKQGIYKNIEIRYYNNEYLFTIVQAKNNNAFAKVLCEELEMCDINFSVYVSVNAKPNSLIYGQLTQISKNKSTHSPFAFLQINNKVKNIIYEDIKKYTEGDVVVDAYAGRCELSSKLATNAKSVYAIEIEKQSCEDAEKLKNNNKISNLFIKNGDCALILPNLCTNFQIDSIILDPPRKGVAEEVINQILRAKPKQIIYLSCNSATLARDLKLLLNNNLYEINQITPYDMFPQTAEVETLAILRKKDGKR